MRCWSLRDPRSFASNVTISAGSALRRHRIQVGWLRSHRSALPQTGCFLPKSIHFAPCLSPREPSFCCTALRSLLRCPFVKQFWLRTSPARFASPRSAARAAARSQNGLTKGQPKSERSAVQQKDGSRGDKLGAKCIHFGRKHPVWGRAPLPRLASTVYYNLIV